MLCGDCDVAFGPLVVGVGGRVEEGQRHDDLQRCGRRQSSSLGEIRGQPTLKTDQSPSRHRESRGDGADQAPPRVGREL